MTSNVNYLSINENFPVPGQDNDTQVFRDNFDTIKTSFRVAKEEISELQDETAKLTSDNNFNFNKIQNAVLENVREQKLDTRGADPITASPTTVDFQNVSYQIFRIGSNITLDFLNFPGDSRLVPEEETPIGMAKVMLELYSDGVSPRTVTFLLSGSGASSIKSFGFPTPGSVILESSTDPVIIEVWRHRTEEFFMRYVGIFA